MTPPPAFPRAGTVLALALCPERFGERIDLDWQKAQIAREDPMGFGAADPALPPPAI